MVAARLAAGIRRPTAILFADLEGSAQLAKRLPTASFFSLVRRITRAADQCVIDAGGLVGRHVGGGFASFFVAYVLGFKVSLRLTFVASAVVAIVSTAVSTVLFLSFRSLG